jgi:hypothetical protein
MNQLNKPAFQLELIRSLACSGMKANSRIKSDNYDCYRMIDLQDATHSFRRLGMLTAISLSRAVNDGLT